jgi:hypothetical protein
MKLRGLRPYNGQATLAKSNYTSDTEVFTSSHRDHKNRLEADQVLEYLLGTQYHSLEPGSGDNLEVCL